MTHGPVESASAETEQRASPLKPAEGLLFYRTSDLMVTSETTGPYKEDHFQHLFATIRDAAG